MTEAQKLVLENIAYQLPLFGGNAVYQARAILDLEVMDDYSNLRIYKSQDASSSKDLQPNIFYPNPARGEITVNYNCEKECNVEIYELTGKLVLKKLLENNKLSVKILVSGSYIFKLRSGDQIIAEELINIIN